MVYVFSCGVSLGFDVTVFLKPCCSTNSRVTIAAVLTPAAPRSQTSARPSDWHSLTELFSGG